MAAHSTQGNVPTFGGATICSFHNEKAGKHHKLLGASSSSSSLAAPPATTSFSSGQNMHGVNAAEFYVENLTEHNAWEASDIMEKLAYAERKRRKVAQTKYNEVSSRSHTVLTLTILCSWSE